MAPTFHPGISPLTLGTVQLGMPYGLNPRDRAPDRAACADILRAAADCGINTLDTARTYGEAEEVLGDLLRSDDGGAFPHVVTKFVVPEACRDSIADMRAHIRGSLAESLSRLGRKRVTGFLFHKGIGPASRDFLGAVGRILTELRREGLIEHGGLSAYRPEDVEAILGDSAFSLVQAPMNIFDAALLRDGWLSRLGDDGVFIFVRSVFLKGLLLQAPGSLPPGLQDAAPHLEALQDLAGRAGMDLPSLVFSYVRHMAGVGSVVFGVNEAAQVGENAALLQAPPLPDGVREEALERFRGLPQHIIVPGLWKD